MVSNREKSNIEKNVQIDSIPKTVSRFGVTTNIFADYVYIKMSELTVQLYFNSKYNEVD